MERVVFLFLFKGINLNQLKEIPCSEGLAAGLKYVYTGNVPGNAAENTFCPGCGKIVIERWGFQVGNLRIKDGRCTRCGTGIEGVWQ